MKASTGALVLAGLGPVALFGGSAMQLHLQPTGSDGNGSYFRASFSIIKPLTPACAGTA